MSKNEQFIGRHTIYDETGTRYMTRMWIGRLRLHIFHRGDNDPDCHDHPWDFWTFPLTPYVEEVVRQNLCETCGLVKGGCGQCAEMWAPSHVTFKQIVPAWRWSFRRATHCHRVLGRYFGSKPQNSLILYDERRILEPRDLYGPGKIVTLVWRSKVKRAWGFLKSSDGKWCWVAWRDYVFGGGKRGPCE